MHNLTAHHLRFSLEVESTIELDEHKGSALRGLLFHALRGPQGNPALGFCVQRHLRTCAECALVAACPVASLVSTLNPEAERGRDVPRPYAIKPPLESQHCYEPGTCLNFGLTLFGNALNLFPYVVMGLRQAGAGGVGKKLPRPEAGGRPYRGRFHLRSAQAINLLTGEAQDILQPDNPLVQRPDVPVTHAQVVEWSQHLLSQPLAHSTNGHSSHKGMQRGTVNRELELTLTFKTPTRIIAQDKLLKEPHFSPLFHRLLNRLLDLSREFSDDSLSQEAIQAEKAALLALSDGVALAGHQTRWVEVWSYSSRQGGKTPIGGLMGQATYRASRETWERLLPYLLWGSLIHVGKNAVKGDGMIAVSL